MTFAERVNRWGVAALLAGVVTLSGLCIAAGAAQLSVNPAADGSTVSFDPKPEPPARTGGVNINPGGRVGFDPQPDPPTRVINVGQR